MNSWLINCSFPGPDLRDYLHIMSGKFTRCWLSDLSWELIHVRSLYARNTILYLIYFSYLYMQLTWEGAGFEIKILSIV